MFTSSLTTDCLRLQELNKGEWWELNFIWEFGSAGMWDNVPVLGRFTTALDPDMGGSDMSAKRAKQMHMFDRLWSLPATGTSSEEGGGEDYYYKREFLEVEDLLFTCGFDISRHDGLMRAAPQSLFPGFLTQFCGVG